MTAGASAAPAATTAVSHLPRRPSRCSRPVLLRIVLTPSARPHTAAPQEESCAPLPLTPSHPRIDSNSRTAPACLPVLRPLPAARSRPATRAGRTPPALPEASRPGSEGPLRWRPPGPAGGGVDGQRVRSGPHARGDGGPNQRAAAHSRCALLWSRARLRTAGAHGSHSRTPRCGRRDRAGGANRADRPVSAHSHHGRHERADRGTRAGPAVAARGRAPATRVVLPLMLERVQASGETQDRLRPGRRRTWRLPPSHGPGAIGRPRR